MLFQRACTEKELHYTLVKHVEKTAYLGKVVMETENDLDQDAKNTIFWKIKMQLIVFKVSFKNQFFSLH